MNTQLVQVSINASAAGARRLTAPKFHSFTDARKHCKERLAATFRLFSYFGFDEGVAGHVTARDPEFSDRFWVNPLGLHFSEIRARDLILVDHKGEVLEGEYPVNRAAFAIHSQIHKARPDIIAVAHAHSMYGKTWSTLGRTLDPITQDACAFYEDHAIFHSFNGVVTEVSEGELIAAALGERKAIILQNHGLLTVGKSIDMAAWFFISMERCCQSQLLAEAVDTPQKILHEVAISTRNFIASDFAAWGSFQPLYHFILKRYPDLVE